MSPTSPTGPPAARPIRLVVTAGKQPPRPVDLPADRATIGRSPRADLTLDDPFASRLHAELRGEGSVCWVSDLGSSNGTFLNEVPVTGPVQVFPGDRIRIGETEMVLEEPAPGAAAAGGVTSPLTRPVELTGTGARRDDLATVLARVERASGTVMLDLPRPARDLFSVVSKVGLALLSPSSLDEVLERILELTFDGIPAERAFLLLREGDESAEPRLRAASYRDPQRRIGPEAVRISRTVVGEVLEEGRSVLSTDAQSDERFRARDSVILSGVRSVMAVPLTVEGKTLGLIYVDSPLEVRPFTSDDLQVLTTIAGVAAIKLENALLLEQRLEHQRLKDEIQRARDIQLRLLPSRAPSLAGFDLSGVSFPCYEVGGDYFDFVPGADGGLLLALGDVSGKGLDAALLMSSLQAAIRSQMQTAPAVGELVQRVNRYLCGSFPFNKFATLFCGLLEPDGRELVYANAGHSPALLVHADGAVEELPASGLPVGLESGEAYAPQRRALASGDVLVVYSDGVSEAASPDGSMLESAGLAELVRGLRELPAGKIVDHIDAALVEYTAGAEATDDMTLLVVKRE
jgi:phosphoserine phosphatase RsbU/P